MFWYENNVDLYQSEITNMSEEYPDFEILKLSDGTERLFWTGLVVANVFRRYGTWLIHLVYENEIEGLVRAYPVIPHLDDLHEEFSGRIPHVYEDENQKKYICTNNPRDIRSGRVTVMGASELLKKTCQWIDLFELWVADEITDDFFKQYHFN